MRHPGHEVRQLVAVAAQNRRQVRIHHRRIAARHQFHQGTHTVRHRHLRKSDLAGDARRGDLVMHVAIAVQKNDGTGPQTRRRCADCNCSRRAPPHPSPECFAVRTDAFGGFDNPFIQHFRQHDAAVEQARPACVAILSASRKAPGDHQHSPLTLALQQRVGGNGRAHLHAGNLLAA